MCLPLASVLCDRVHYSASALCDRVTLLHHPYASSSCAHIKRLNVSCYKYYMYIIKLKIVQNVVQKLSSAYFWSHFAKKGQN